MNIHSIPLLKFPRTPHLEGSRLQKGDDASDQVALRSLAGRHSVLEEKVDGANSAVSFSDAAALLLQSRGHYLVGGGSERQFNAFKPWAAAHEDALLRVLEDRYVMYGEWCYAKHSIFYDCLPHYFNEFDIYDRQTGKFLSTGRRRALLTGLPIVQVPVLYEGPMPTDPKLLRKLVYRSLGKTCQWKSAFERNIAREGQNLEMGWKQTDKSERSEGLYLKIEENDEVVARFKYVRPDFVQTILDSGSHHSQRPVLPNLLAPGVNLYAPQPTVTWESLGLKTIRGIDELKAVPVTDLEYGRPGDLETTAR